MEIDERLERIITAIRTVNQYHNLGDAVYEVRSRVFETDPGYKGESWDHPSVKTYGDAVATIEKEIGGWGKPVEILPTPLPCPFCGEPPTVGRDEVHRESSIRCTNIECPTNPEVTSATSCAAALERWNKRVAP